MNIQEELKKVNELSYKLNTTKDEKEKNELNDELKEILNNLKKDAISKFQSESDIKKFLDNISRFNNYSFNNQLLIHAQSPDSTYVAPLRTYSHMGYMVNKGAKSIKIIIPTFYKLISVKQLDGTSKLKYSTELSSEENEMLKDPNNKDVTLYKEMLGNFRIGHIFDASQTTMPLDEINKELYPTGSKEDRTIMTETFVKAIYRDGFKVSFTDKIENGAKGYCNHKDKLIVILDTLGTDMKLKVLIHEYAHALSHQHLTYNNQEYKDHRDKYETEAESIAYVVSKHLGIDTNDSSANYLYAWSKNKDFQEIEDSFSMIVNNSKKIINNFEKMYEKTLNNFQEELDQIISI